MHRRKHWWASLAGIAVLWVLVAPQGVCADAHGVDGRRAMRHVEHLVAIGPRAAGSRQLEQARKYIEREVAAISLAVERLPFNAATPGGPLPMVNLLVKIPGKAPGDGRPVLITGHYDTKRFLDRDFVGANDGGSSTALLLELARVLSAQRLAFDVWVVFFDGEESIGTWTETDSLYGSRQLAQEMQRSGQLAKIRTLINVDMVGDRDLQLVDEYYSHRALRQLAREVAVAMGKPRLFGDGLMAVEDDHLPFVQRGVPALNLIDFDFGPGNRYWHTAEDSLDKLSAESFQTVGSLVLGILKRLESSPALP